MPFNVSSVSVKNEDLNLKKFNNKEYMKGINDVNTEYEKINYNQQNYCHRNRSIASYIIDQYIKQKTEIRKKYLEKIEGLDKDSIEYRNATLDYRISLAGYGTRKAVVAAAKYLSEEEDIPYYWGGKRLEHGIDETWGQERVMNWDGTDVQFKGSSYPYGLDCSGFVSWAIYNGGFNIETSWTGGYADYAQKYDFSVENLKGGKIQEGDLLYRDGHIAIITDLNVKDNTIKVAEEKGYYEGMVVTELNIDDYVKNANFTSILSMEDFYNNDKNIIK